MHALTHERVEIDGKSRNQGLALASAHFGDPTRVQRGTAHQLNVVVPLSNRATRSLAHDRERFGQEIVNSFTALQAGAELWRLSFQRVVAEGTNLVRPGVNVWHDRGQGLYFFALTGTEDAVENRHATLNPICAARAPESPRPRRRLPS